MSGYFVRTATQRLTLSRALATAYAQARGVSLDAVQRGEATLDRRGGQPMFPPITLAVSGSMVPAAEVDGADELICVGPKLLAMAAALGVTLPARVQREQLSRLWRDKLDAREAFAGESINEREQRP